MKFAPCAACPSKSSKGQLFTLLGPSGCGKTTTLRCIAGLEQPLEGEISVNDRAVFSASNGIFVPPEQRRIGMVFQSYAIWPHMTVFQNVAYPLANDMSRKELADRVDTNSGATGFGWFGGSFGSESERRATTTGRAGARFGRPTGSAFAR